MAEVPRKRLVLVGGGHVHAQALLHLAREPIAGLDVVLISEGRYSPYNGMMSGFFAGLYKPQDIYIDLEALCWKAGARFLMVRVQKIDPAKKTISTTSGGSILYDFLSINCGAGPDIEGILGAPEHAFAVKPIPRFQKAWENFLERMKSTPNREPVRLVQVGAGAAGCECAAAMVQRLHRDGVAVDLQIIEAADRILPNTPVRVSAIAERVVREAGGQILTGRRVVEVKNDGVILDDGTFLPSDFTAVATSSRPARWLRELAYEHTDEGFLKRDEFLRTSDPNTFAVGEVARHPSQEMPHEEIDGGSQAWVLYENWRSIVQGDDLKAYQPSRNNLILLIDGLGRAYGYRASLVLPRTRMLWRLKDFNDRRFVNQFKS